MKIVFLGSDIAFPVLKALYESEHEVLAVVCQPDKPNARGNKMEISSLKTFALEKNIPVLQYGKIRAEGVEDLKKIQPDMLISAAYGQIISQEIIDISKTVTLNVHPSLLPKYRGPSPIITPILNGDKETGVSIMRMVYEFDSGATFKIEKTPIAENETAGELSERLFKMGARLLLETIHEIEDGTAVELEQDHAQATYCHMITKEMAKLDFEKNAIELKNVVRAFNPAPVAYFIYKDERVKVYEADVVSCEVGQSGEVVASSSKEGLIIKAKKDALSIKKLQAPNGKVLDIKSFLNGRAFEKGYIIK